MVRTKIVMTTPLKALVNNSRNCTRKTLIHPLENNRVRFLKILLIQMSIFSCMCVYMYFLWNFINIFYQYFFANFYFRIDRKSENLMIFIFQSRLRNKTIRDNSLRICIVRFNLSMHFYEVKRFKKNVDRNWRVKWRKDS